MAYFATIDSNDVVTLVSKVSDDILISQTGEMSEQLGADFLNDLFGVATRVQTWEGGGPRKNWARLGYTYDANRDAFIPPRPHSSWQLNEDSCLWEPPVPYPSDGAEYVWNEATTSWQLVENGA